MTAPDLDDFDLDLSDLLQTRPAPADGAHRARRAAGRRRRLRMGGAVAAALALMVAAVAVFDDGSGDNSESLVAGPSVAAEDRFSLRRVVREYAAPCEGDDLPGREETCFDLGAPIVDASHVASVEVIEAGGDSQLGLELTGPAAQALDEYASSHLEERVAIVADAVVVGAPTIQQREFRGKVHIQAQDGFSRAEAKRLAAIIAGDAEVKTRTVGAPPAPPDNTKAEAACRTAIPELRDGRETLASANQQDVDVLRRVAAASGQELPEALRSTKSKAVALCLTHAANERPRRCSDGTYRVDGIHRAVEFDGTPLGEMPPFPDSCTPPKTESNS